MRQLLRALLIVALAGGLGCRLVDPQSKKGLALLPLAGSPEAVTLEIYAATMPLDDPHLTSLWNEVDEQPIGAEPRSRLNQNGLRVGIAGPHVSDALAEVLHVTDRPIAAEDRHMVPLDSEPNVTLRVRQFQFRKRSELAVSPLYDQISLLRSVDGEVTGKTYQKAECRFELRVYPEADGRVRLELLPQLHHGEFKQRFSGTEGVLRMEPLRAIQTFDDLKFSATLGAGQMLLLTCEADRPGSIGHHFFSQAASEKPAQRLWVLRMAQAGPDRMFYEVPKDDEQLSSDEDL